MNVVHSFSVALYLYWVLLLLITLAALILAILAFRLRKQPFAIASAGSLAAALLLAALPMGEAPAVFVVAIGLAGLALAVIGGGPVALLALQLATQNSVSPGSHGGILVGTDQAPATAAGTAAGTEESPTAVHEVLRGGLTIGVLERLAVTGAILAGFPEALAVVVAIKGVGRFTELASGEARERFIIGTLASLIWACACAILVSLAQS
jgi:hypothetical protein